VKRVCVVCEVMHQPFDEGIRIFAVQLARALAVSEKQKLLLLSERDSEFDGLAIHGALSDRWFLGRDLAHRIASFAPEAIVYVPWTSLTARTLIRVRVLRRYAPGCRIAVVALQPRPADLMTRGMARLGRPDVVLVAGPGAQRQAGRLGLPARRIAPGVDLARFHPAAPEQRERLRQRAGVAAGRFVVLHVGHMKESRNLAVIEQLAALEGVTCMVVASTSTLADTALSCRLAAAGALVMSHHEDRIEHAYRLADAYLFPVTSELDAIETPLSVLEAAACDLAIVSTPFGGLPDLLGGAAVWTGTPAGMIEAVRTLAAARATGAAPAASTRTAVAGLTWERLARQVMLALEGREETA